MNLYVISRPYSDAVVAAKSKDAARRMHPDGSTVWDPDYRRDHWPAERPSGAWVACQCSTDADAGEVYTWPMPEKIQVKKIGVAIRGTKPGVICTQVTREPCEEF